MDWESPDEDAPSTVFCLSPDALFEQFQDGALVLCRDSLRLYELNHTASTVLALTDGQRRVGDVAAAVADRFDESGPDLVDDIVALCRDLGARGIVRVAQTPTAVGIKG